MLEIGDVVELKSGGAKMVVVEIGDDRLVKCVWQDRTKHRGHEHKERSYPADVLRRAGKDRS